MVKRMNTGCTRARLEVRKDGLCNMYGVHTMLFNGFSFFILACARRSKSSHASLLMSSCAVVIIAMAKEEELKRVDLKVNVSCCEGCMMKAISVKGVAVQFVSSNVPG
ncbi:hypothetical protein GUJ93_ZPchr0458g22554 [Zizania palustris]|uniref:HMA domain-containing protein n=1 Tax=Zizania palustris TaxID=103762 RepID=A0A8J5V2I7_ZIZPA|nr:hypothetical protein GUJ93_ZPchr0458g22554 [Zizania palustris]